MQSVNRVTAGVALVQTRLPKIAPDPREGVDELRRQDRAYRESHHAAQQLESINNGDINRAIKELRNRFGLRYPIMSENNGAHGRVRSSKSGGSDSSVNENGCNGSRSGSGWAWYDARYMIAAALGAPRPVWDGVTQSWWMDRERGNPLSSSTKPGDVAALAFPE